MAVDSTSTDAQVITQLENSAGFEDSWGNCRDFLQAARILINRLPETGSLGGKTWKRQDLQKEIDRASKYYEALSTSRAQFTRGRPL